MAKKYDIIETTTVETLWGGEVTRKKIKDDYSAFAGQKSIEKYIARSSNKTKK